MLNNQPLVECIGRNGIAARVLCDSISPKGSRMTTLETEYPRFILAEINTHRMLSKNSASSRAIPTKQMHQHLVAEPVSWGVNKSGMQAATELEGAALTLVKAIWNRAKEAAIQYSNQLAEIGLHKQITNRVTEPWMMMKTVISGTEWANLFFLRDHEAAQPEFRELAHLMQQVMLNSTPQELQPGEWHLPYIQLCRDKLGMMHYQDANGQELSLRQARMVSASCCAQVSYRKNNDTIEKAEQIYHQLIESIPAHASPVEHQATPMPPAGLDSPFSIAGCTHVDRYGYRWSGNLREWEQFRKLIPNEAVWGRVEFKQP